MSSLLQSLRIALPETRQLDALARLLEKQGAEVERCPLVSIHDSPEVATVNAWLERFIASPPDEFVILTGEGIRRLGGFAERAGCLDDWVRALSKPEKLARGPKPGKALRELGLRSDTLSAQPTTEGVIETLEDRQLEGHRVAVQLYGSDPNHKLMDYLEKRGAQADPVAPYVYADEMEDAAVIRLIESLAEGRQHLLCFTSQPQLKRLRQVARRAGLESTLEVGLQRVALAAIGPVMGQLLEDSGYTVAVQPREHFFMRDLVEAIAHWWQQQS